MKLIPYTKINSKWIKDSNERFETIKLLEGNLCGKLPDIEILAMTFLDLIPKVQAPKAKKTREVT